MSMFEGWRQFFSPQSEEIIYPYGSAIVQPKAWIRYTQPNGWVYYYHPILRVITSEDIHDTEMVESILSCAAEHLACMEDDGSIVHLPNDWQISMVLVDPDGEDPFAISMQSWNDMGSYTSSEENGFQRIQNKSHFWETVVEYPMHRPLPLAAETEFLGALSRGADESSLGVKSIFPYDGRQLKLLLRIYRDLKALRDAGEKVPALDWYFGRVMCEIEHHHETTFETGTPITHHAAYHQKTEDEYWIRVLDVLLSFFFFGTHKMYRGRLRATEPRGCPHLPYFRKLMTSLLVEWAGHRVSCGRNCLSYPLRY
ncbi:hypothetical protein BD779DRAFT_659551 [Infundibulicybe gibba]|nr:hypothetical protein BD779DRAFT_659551 [Infundibulicybe gibba]